ncbi:MAG: hypothetical protein LBU50_00910, partial [Cellulomonas sp.]|nr:hypothetical protein [Cellulomonas sp.]
MTARTTTRKILAAAVAAVIVGWSVPAAAVPSAPVPAAAPPTDTVQVDELEVLVEEPRPGSPTDGPTVDPGADDAVLADRSLPGDRVATEVVETTDYQTIGVTWPVSESGEDLGLQVRTMTDGTWSPWVPLDSSDSSPDVGTADAQHAAQQSATARGGTDSLWIGDAAAVQLSVRAVADVADVRLAAVGSTPVTVLAAPAPAPALAAASAPAVITRAQWGAAAPTCAMDSAPLVGAVLHHTAGSNNYNSTAAAMQQIRNDQRYHMQSRG